MNIHSSARFTRAGRALLVRRITQEHWSVGEALTGAATPCPDDTMSWLALDHQLSALPVALGGTDGLLVTTFLHDDTATLSDDPRYGGTDGWSPGTGSGLHFGYPGPNPGNAYARIFVNVGEPTAAPTQGQLDELAYADCAPGGMMGAACMTGTSVAGYGTAGTMGGRPSSQETTRPWRRGAGVRALRTERRGDGGEDEISETSATSRRGATSPTPAPTMVTWGTTGTTTERHDSASLRRPRIEGGPGGRPSTRRRSRGIRRVASARGKSPRSRPPAVTIGYR